MKKIILILALALAIKIVIAYLEYLEDRPLREFYQMHPKPFGHRYTLSDIEAMKW